MKSLAVLSSVPFESDRLLASLKNVRSIKVAGKKVFRGRLSGRDILLLNTGIGKVNAAHSATCVIENFPVSQIINIGVGGAYPGSGLNTGDLAIASKEIFGDEGVITSGGWKDMTEIGIPVVHIGKKKYFNEFPLNNAFAKKVFKLVTRHLSLVTKSGIFVTVSSTTGTRKRAAELEKRFKAVCENMEGAAIAQVCAIYKIPFLEIRGISNMVAERDKRKWDLKLASENCQEAVLEVIKNAF
ncbi:MAG: futalosine hydrolase [Nitrospirae bacterium]|nr:futalosine hydrolase [Nitrospirota bacterium]